MRINLLGDNGYCGMDGVEFPIDVDASICANGTAHVNYSELVRIGADGELFFDDLDPAWPFDVGCWEPVRDGS